MAYSTQTHPIKYWAEEDRPREKLLLKGRTAVSNAELIAMIIGMGSHNESAVDLCKRILASQNQNLEALGRLTVQDLQKYKGIGQAKAIQIVAALELGKRRQSQKTEDRPKISGSADIYQLIGPLIYDLNYEEFWVIFLNRKNEVIHKECISSGGLSGTVVDPKIVFKRALDHFTSSIVLVHNHPSGNLNPSRCDREITKRIFEAGKLLEISVHDHIIVGGKGYFSFSDEGIL